MEWSFLKERRVHDPMSQTLGLPELLGKRASLIAHLMASTDLAEREARRSRASFAILDHTIIPTTWGLESPMITIFQHAMQLLDIEASEGFDDWRWLTTDIPGSNEWECVMFGINHHEAVRTDEISKIPPGEQAISRGASSHYSLSLLWICPRLTTTKWDGF